jgi:hypothetical protein
MVPDSAAGCASGRAAIYYTVSDHKGLTMADQQSTIGELIATVTANALGDELKPPFVICLVNPDGAVLALRSYQDREPEVLVNHGSGHGAGLQGVGILLDQSGQKRTWTMSPIPNA